MKKLSLILLLLICVSTINAYGEARTSAPPCPDEKTLTREARIALVEAQKLMEDEKSSQALKRLTEFCAKHPDESHTFISATMAGLYMETGQMEKARTYYERTIKRCPAYAPAWQNLGKVCYDLGRFTRAAQAMENAWELTGRTNHTLRFHAAVALISAKKPAAALAHLEFLTSGQAGPPLENWVKLMVRLSIEEKKSARAVKTVERLLAAPKAPPYLFRLAASLYLDLNLYDKAVQNLTAYSLLKPLPQTEQTLLAHLYINQGIPAKAAETYQKALAHDPSRELYEHLASAWFEACDMEKAIDAIDSGLSAYPRSQPLWKLKGWIYYETKKFDQAATAFERASKLNKKDTKSLFMHGFCAWQAGKTGEARKILKQAAVHSRYKTQAMSLIRQMENQSNNS